MGWIGVITNAGEAALRQCLAEGITLNINAAKGGSGSVPQANMRSATALVSEKSSGTIVRKVPRETGVEIVAMLTAATTGYTMTEVGIYGTIDGNSVMIALYQNENGVEIPASSVFPDFAYSLAGLWDIENMEDLTVSISPSALLSAYQGPENAGKYLIVDSNGFVVPTTVPFANGGTY